MTIQQTLSNQYAVKIKEQIFKLCHQIELKQHFNKIGPKIFTNHQRIALVVLFHRSGKALRKFIEELPESKWPGFLDLKCLPSKSVLHSWIKKFFNLSFLRSFLEEFLKKKKPTLMAVDATGIDSWQRSRHYERRMKKGVNETPMPYAKVDLLVDTDTLMIYDHILRVKPRHDVLGAETIFKRKKRENVLILGDKGYDSEPLHEVASRNGLEFYAPVRDFHVKKPSGKHRQQCWKNPPAEASRRSLVESVIRSLKSRFKSLRSRLPCMKKRELAWHVLVYNMERARSRSVNFLFYLFRITILDRAWRR